MLASKEALPLATDLILPSEEVAYIPDRVKKALKRITASPFDTEAWSVLIRDIQSKNIVEGRKIFEQLVTQFPTAGRYWKIYIESEMKARNYERVENLFQRCLVHVLHMDLWKLYLSYIKETKVNLPSFREKMARAYDFALEKIGMDVTSYQIWVDYIHFLKSVEAVGSYAENQRITAVRKVYQRGIINPMLNIEVLWKDYVAYENGINPLIGKKMTEDRSREYSNSKRVTKDLDLVTRGLNRNQIAAPPTNSVEEFKQVEMWKKYIQFEKKNPLRTEEHAVITKRVMYAYEQALLCLAYHPDIWYEAATFLEQSSKLLSDKGDPNAGKMFAEETASIYERAIAGPMKQNMLMYFAYADFEEGRIKYEKVHGIYKRFIELEGVDPTLAFVQYMKFARRAEGIKSARAVFKMARENPLTRYHAYVAAALMEFYCSKDQTVALRIFELGLKKFGDQVDYVLCYLDFMSNLNDDNNTRVLFEKVLSSGQIPPEKCIEIWSRFTAFEAEVGDLSSIVKVDKRRMQLLDNESALHGKETAILIDRYKYLDLLPCSQSELLALGYVDSCQKPTVTKILSSQTETSKTSPLDTDSAKVRVEYPRPNTDHMIPFKPRITIPTNAHPIEGGVFPPPPAASRLLTLLPPPVCFRGPFVKIDAMMDHFNNLTLPDVMTFENGIDGPDPGTQLTIENMKAGNKRKTRTGDSHDSDDEDTKVAPPVHDIYRNRLQKRVK